MSSMYWMKLYHEMLDDPKMGQMSDRLYRRTIELFLLAGELDQGGYLPSVKDMSWRLRLIGEELETDLFELQEIGIVTKKDNTWFVVNFAKRQAPISGAERSKRHRVRKRREILDVDESCDEGVTEGVTFRHTDIEQDIDTDTEVDKDTEQQPNDVANLSSKKLIDEMKSLGVHWKRAEMFLNKYDHDQIAKYLRITKEKTSAGKVDDPPAWFSRAIVDKYVLSEEPTFGMQREDDLREWINAGVS